MSEIERPEINQVLEHYGARVRDRRSYMTNCIFHEDRTPSLSVNTEKGVWNCKSCGQHGDSFNLIMLKEETDFGGAREFAAAHDFAAGAAGGGDSDIRGSAYSSRRGTTSGKGTRRSNGGYVPRWRRS